MSINSQIHRVMILLTAITLLLGGCSQDDKKDPSTKKGIDTAARMGSKMLRTHALVSNQILVLDEKDEPVGAATLHFGQTAQTQQVVQTDPKGLTPLPDFWVSALPVTITAPGFAHATYFAQTPGAKIYRVRHLENVKYTETSGQTIGIATPSDGQIDFALIVPTLSREELLNFDLNQMMSPVEDALSIAGHDVTLPSNAVLPNQTENYLFFPININKPNFRVFTRASGTHSLAGLHGRVSLSNSISAFSDGFDLIKFLNLANFQSVGQESLTLGSQTVSIPATQTSLTRHFNVQTPSIPAGQSLIAFSLESNAQRGGFVFEDIKGTTSGRSSMVLTSAAASPQVAYLTLRSQDVHAQAPNASPVLGYSLGIFPGAEASTASLLALAASPRVQNAKSVQLSPPKPLPNVAEQKTIGSLSQLVTVSLGNTKIKARRSVWDIYASTWQTAIQLPEITDDNAFTGSLRWDVSFLTATKANDSDLSNVEQVNRISTSAQEFHP